MVEIVALRRPAHELIDAEILLEDSPPVSQRIIPASGSAHHKQNSFRAIDDFADRAPMPLHARVAVARPP